MSGIRPFAFWATFAAVAAILYVVAMEMNLAAVTYHPRLGTWAWGADPPKSGPAMYWYGWMITSALGGVIAGLIAAAAAGGASAKAWLRLGWVVPACAMAAAAYFMIPFFTVS